THGLRGSSERLERLMPGESRQVPLDAPPAGALGEVIAAGVARRPPVGGGGALNAPFTPPPTGRHALKGGADPVSDGLPPRHGAEALAALRQRFTALVQREESIPCRAALDAVQAFQQKSSAEEIDNSLRTYAEFVNKEYALAEKHSRRGGIRN